MAPRTRRRDRQGGSDLPSLFPTHDGSYGINTLISPVADQGKESKRGHKSAIGHVDEESDDEQWERTVKGKSHKKYRMNSDLRAAIDESHKEVDSEHEGRQPGSQGPDSELNPRLEPTVPRYNPNIQNFAEEPDERPRRSFTRVESDSLSPDVLGKADQPTSSVPEHIPFYGMPQGGGSKQPISPDRPDSSRSFDYESALYSNATLHTPGAVPYPDLGSPSPSHAALLAGPFEGSGAVGQQLGSAFPVEEPATRPSQPSGPSIAGRQAGPSRQSVPRQQARTQTTSTQPAPPPQPQTLSSSAWGKAATVPPPLPIPESNTQPQSAGIRPSPVLKSSAWGQLATSNRRAPAPPPTARQLSPPDSKEYEPEQNTFQKRVDLPSPPDSTEPIFIVPQGPDPPKPVHSFLEEEENSPSRSPTPVPEELSQARPKPKPKPNPNASTTPRPGGRHNVSAGSRVPTMHWGMLRQCAELVFMFSGLAVTLWFVLAAIQRMSSDIDTGSLRTGINLPSIHGATSLWGSISNLLPDIPSLNYPDAPSRLQEMGDIDYKKLASQLKANLPGSIWVSTDKSGKIKIPEDMLHALKELIRKDETIVRPDNSGLSDSQWAEIESRIQAGRLGGGEGTSTDVPGVSPKQVEDIVDNKMSRSWETWLEQNAKDHLSGVALSKDDFLKLFQQEAASYQREIKQELKDLQERTKGIAQHVSKVQDGLSSAGGIAKHEAKRLIESMVAKAMDNAKLDAITRGVIKGHANDVLANHVDFFGIGSGASIDSSLSSPPWKPPKPKFKSKKWFEKDGYHPQPRQAVLTPWNQEGECFCAGPDLHGYGMGTNNISVLMSRSIIPQHLVVEHILPGATLDPGAMPRDIEMWAYYDEVNLRKEVRAFSASYFPNTPEEVTLNEGWVKIGHFTYEKKNHGDGVQVFKLSDELARMGAHAYQVVIRAINNYGADHTCFYRLRLFGEIVERPEIL
ncbi:hypothetical protein GGS20DRAFT_305403 [Poronia punctata]|nr:hypothetical protein GGS20DRAFT_305403 [Poronia punctata]